MWTQLCFVCSVLGVVEGLMSTPKGQNDIEMGKDGATPSPISECSGGDCDGLTHYEKKCHGVTGWDQSINSENQGCAVLVNTNGGTCSNYCSTQQRTCIRAQDNTGSSCTLDSRHSRQSVENNGCEQEWNNQVCVCSCGPIEPTVTATGSRCYNWPACGDGVHCVKGDSEALDSLLATGDWVSCEKLTAEGICQRYMKSAKCAMNTRDAETGWNIYAPTTAHTTTTANPTPSPTPTHGIDHGSGQYFKFQNKQSGNYLVGGRHAASCNVAVRSREVAQCPLNDASDEGFLWSLADDGRITNKKTGQSLHVESGSKTVRLADYVDGDGGFIWSVLDNKKIKNVHFGTYICAGSWGEHPRDTTVTVRDEEDNKQYGGNIGFEWEPTSVAS